MDLQRCGAVRNQARRFGSGWRDRSGRYVLVSVFWLLCSVLLGMGGAHAQSTSYVYDANGRVVAVTASNGTSVQYSYNTLGHTSQISAPLAPGQLAIFAFVPTHGEAGTQVTIQGQGFDSNVANDTVSFNGTVATVLSASATQLVTTVPDGATTGPITITVGTQTASSATPFVVDDTGLPPAISQVSPAVVSVGDAVTVTGVHLDPLAGGTTVQMGGRDIPTLSAVSDTQLQYTVPSTGTSGYVTVATAYGLAISPTPVIVLPGGIGASNVVSSGNASVNGSGVNLNIGASGQYGAVTFTAPQSGWVSLQASGITTSASSINYTVYAPGNSVVQQGTISASSPSIHLPHLTAGGIYLVLVQPSGSGAQMTLAVEANALLATNAAATVVTTVPGQSKRVLFNALAGQNLAFQINGTTTNPSGYSVTYTVYAPNGASYTSATTASTGVINLGNLPAGGTYQVLIAPGSGVSGTMQVEVTPGVTGTLNGTPQNYVANVPGQNIYLSFTATQGEDLELTLNNVNDAGATYNQFPVYVYNAAGTQIASFWCYASNPGQSCNQHLWYLPAGTYSVVASPYYGGVLSFTALAEQDLSGGVIPVNGTASIALAAGQVERYTFNANAGDTVALNVAGVTTSPAGQGVAFLVYRPDAGAITTSTPAYTSFGPAGAQTVNLPNLPVSGTYTVIVAPNYGLAASAQLSVVGGATATLPTDGSSQNYSANVTGQNVYLSFTATQGQNLELVLNNVNDAGGQYNQFQVSVYNAAGGQVASFWCYASNPGQSCNQHLWYLPAGTYSVVATPNYGGVLSFNALIQPDITGPVITDNAPVSISLGAGQVERYTFNANAGDTIALNVSGVTTTPAGQGVTFQVYRPDAGAITTNTPAYTAFGPASAQTVNLPNLPVSGTYTVIVTPNYGLAASAQLNVVSGVTATLPTDGTQKSYAANVTGENVYLSFTATQGQNLELVLNNVNDAGGQYNQFQVYVYNAAGSQVASFWCYASNPGASCNQHLWNLAAGTYSVIATPNYGGTLSFNALIQQDVVGPALTSNTTQAISLSAGQVVRYTFNANAGDTIALNVSGVTTTPTGQGVTFLVYRPDAGVITTGTSAYTSFGPTIAQTVNLANLPVGGTYTIIVTPNYGLAATAQLEVVSGATGSLPTGGTPQSYAANITGENVYLSFNATQDQNLELTLNNVNDAGGQYNQFQVYVYNAAGGQIASFWCYASNPGASCSQHLWNLAAGTYSVVATPNYGGVISFNALIEPDITGSTIASGDSASIALNAGQVERYTFAANAGDTVMLGVSRVSTTPAGQGVNFAVYRPDSGAINTGTPAYSSFSPTASQNVTLSNLPVSGTYTVIVSPGYGLPANGQLSVLDTAGSAPTYGTATLPSTGVPQSESASAAGQNVTMTFNANWGDNLELTFSNINTTGGNSGYNEFHAYIYDPHGAGVADFYCHAADVGSSCRVPLFNLMAGTYSVVVTPSQGGVIHFTAILEPETIGPSLTMNNPVTVNLSAGEEERLTFNANVGDTVALVLSSVSSTSPIGQPVYVAIWRPDVGAITPSNIYTSFSATGSTVVNLSNLPASGTYTLAVYTSNGTPASAQLTLIPGAMGSIVSNGTAQTFAANTVGQNVYLSFNANLGDNLELTFNNINTTGGNSGYNEFHAYLYDPHGSFVTDFYCHAADVGSSCRQPLFNLMAGTYSVVVTPSQGGVMHFTTILEPETIGPSLTMNNPVTVNLSAGEEERLTFNANVGDTVALALSGVSSTSPASQPVYVTVWRPDVGAITPSNGYMSFSATSSNVLNLSNLPASGTYTLTVYTSNGTPASAQLTLIPGAIGSVVSNGTDQAFAANTAGQNVYLSFNANPGDNLELTFNNINTIGGNSGYNEFHAYIYDPHGAYVTDYYCHAADVGASCRQPLFNLMAGTYSVVVTPSQGGVMHFTAILEPDTIGPALSMNTPVTINLGAGQVERVTFNGSVGDTVALNLSNVSTTLPSGQPVYVSIYRPDTGAITTNPWTYFGTTGSSTLNLSNLPASGTYTMTVYTTNGTPGSAQLTLIPGATGSVLSNGTAQAFAANVAGENVNFSFNAKLGDNLELTFNNINTTDGNSGYNEFHAYIYDPHGALVTDYYCHAADVGASCRQPLFNLTAGTYSVVVTPSQGGVIHFTAILAPETIGPSLTMNNPVTINLNAGEEERLTFTANVGDTVALTLSGVNTTSPTGQPVYVAIWRPDVGAITPGNTYTSFGTTSSNTLNLSNLPASGTYTLAVYTTNGTPGTAQLMLAPK